MNFRDPTFFDQLACGHDAHLITEPWVVRSLVGSHSSTERDQNVEVCSERKIIKTRVVVRPSMDRRLSRAATPTREHLTPRPYASFTSSCHDAMLGECAAGAALRVAGHGRYVARIARRMSR